MQVASRDVGKKVPAMRVGSRVKRRKPRKIGHDYRTRSENMQCFRRDGDRQELVENEILRSRLCPVGNLLGRKRCTSIFQLSHSTIMRIGHKIISYSENIVSAFSGFGAFKI